MFMKNTWMKFVPIFFLVFALPILFLNPKVGTASLLFSKEKMIEEKISQIVSENQDKNLQIHKNISDKFIYLEFLKEDEVYSYFISADTGEENDFSYFVRPGCEKELESKIVELLYLKYPKFIADAITKEEVNRTYQIKDNALVIYFSNVVTDPEITEKLFLTVNYNEIKDFLDFSMLLDEEYTNENGYNYVKEKKAVALTFDDGPSGEKTNRIVELLEQNKAHATFFMVGNKMNYGASTIKNVLDKGNEIGSHSYAHANMKRQKKANLLADEAKTNEIFKSITGTDLLYTRPPYGAINTTVKDNLDTIFITWNLDTEDWLHRDKNYIVDYVMENVSDGDIILMHDSYDSTVEAVEELLPKLYAAGYQVVSVSELASIADKNLEKHTIYRSFKRS